MTDREYYLGLAITIFTLTLLVWAAWAGHVTLADVMGVVP